MVPVMVMGMFVGGKYYTAQEYGCAALIAAGISLFAQQSPAKTARKLAAPNAPLGYALCLLNLIFDGYTNAAQVAFSSFAKCCRQKAGPSHGCKLLS